MRLWRADVYSKFVTELVRRGVDAAVAPTNHQAQEDISVLLDSAATVLDCGRVRIDGKRRMLREQRPIAQAFDELAKIVANLTKIVEGRADHDTRRSGGCCHRYQH